MRPRERCCAGLGQAEVANLAGLHQPGHRADRVLDRHIRVDAVLVEEVDVVRAEALERGLADAPDVFRAAVQTRDPSGGIDAKAELGRDDDTLAVGAEGAPQQPLVGVGPVDLGGVEEGDAEFERPANGGNRLGLVADAIGPAHAHAAEAQFRDGQPLGAE